MSDPKNFDMSDSETTPKETRLGQDDLERQALVEHNKRLAALESRVSALETQLEEGTRPLRTLRKLLASWLASW